MAVLHRSRPFYAVFIDFDALQGVDFKRESSRGQVALPSSHTTVRAMSHTAVSARSLTSVPFSADL